MGLNVQLDLLSRILHLSTPFDQTRTTFVPTSYVSFKWTNCVFFECPSSAEYAILSLLAFNNLGLHLRLDSKVREQLFPNYGKSFEWTTKLCVIMQDYGVSKGLQMDSKVI